MSVARDALSPMIRSAQVRRLSLELCQKIGNQLLSPSNSPNRNGKNSPAGSLSPASNGGDGSASNSPVSNANACSYYERRGSAGFENLFQPSGIQNPDGVSHGIRPRRYSLIPLGTQKPLLHTPAAGVPSIKVFSAEKEEARQKSFALRAATQRRISYGSDLFSNVSSKTSDLKDDRSKAQEKPYDCSFNAFKSTSEAQEILQICTIVSNDLVRLNAQVLGRGSFGVVVTGFYGGKPVAIKVISTIDNVHKESLENEKNAKLLQHRNITSVLDVIQVLPSTAIVVMEPLYKGNLLKLLNDSMVAIDSKKKIRFTGQIASALAFCHENGILHLDVKPQNVLLDANDNCKLSDFGTSKAVASIEKSASSQRLEGTVAYKAPELFRGNCPTEKCDVYSLGVCMWQILSREEPYKGLAEHAIIYQVVADELRPDCALNSTDLNNNSCTFESDQCTEEFINTYNCCWHSEPVKRPNMQSIVEKMLLLLYSV